MPSPSDPPSTGSMSREELAEADGTAMGRALMQRPTSERAAWWRGVTAAMGGPDAYRGLPEPPEGWQWAEAGRHLLAGSVGLAHLIKTRTGQPGEPLDLTALCGHEAPLWTTVGRWESDRREACPECAGQKVTS